MDIVGRGTVLAGRYRILEPLSSDLVDSPVWHATDQILDRAVRVRILVSGNVPQALDAARRAALVSDPRLVRILDVGSHEGTSYVVTEQVTGPSLSDILAAGPLNGDQARAVVGEAAAALEIARRRGVHHLALRPSVLHITPDDRVLLTGLAFDGALLGQALGDARTTTRADTVGLVRVLYAALTGHWPAGEGDLVPTTGIGTLPPAPMSGGVPVPPGDLVAGIPADLDTLCVVTLGTHEDGPHSPAELIRELEPWGEIRTVGAARNPVGGSNVPTGAAAPEPGGHTAPAPVQRQSVRSTFQQAPTGLNRPGTPPPAHHGTTFPVGAGSAGSSAPHAPRDAPTAPYRPAALHDEHRPQAPYRAQNEARRDVPLDPDRDQRGGTAPQQPVPPDPGPATRSFSAEGVRRAGPAAREIPPPAIPPRVSASPSGAAGRTQPAFGLPFEQVRGPQQPPAPFDTSNEPEPLSERRFDPTRLVIAVVGLAVLIGVIIAVSSLFAPVSGRDNDANRPVPAVTTPAPTQEQSNGAAPATPGAAPAVDTGAAPVVASVSTIDLSDGDGEHEEIAARAVDGDPATAWYTHTYNSPDFAGFKDGVGFVLDLRAKATVSTVTLQVNGTGGNVEVRATSPSDPSGGTLLASGPLSPQTVLTLSEPTSTETIVLWFTSLAQAGDGGNRIEISEITVS